MGIIILICFLIGIISFCSFMDLICKKIKSKIKKENYEIELKFPFDYYEEKPLMFLIIWLIIILTTVCTMSSAILSIVFPNNLRYKPEGTYCYYVIDENNKAYPAKIEKSSYTESDGEDYYGNSRSSTYIYVNLLELFVDSESLEFYDDPQEINTENYTRISYYAETESEDGEYEEIEKEFKIKLTNDVAYCPSFGKGTTKIDYLELIFEILVLVSEISMYIITIYVGRKEKR